MSLNEHFERSGNWLFRRRSFLPLVLVVFMALAMQRYKYFLDSELADHIWEAFCLTVSFLGLAIRAWTIGCAPARTSGRNTKSQVADQLNQTGIYSLVRHPLYIGNYFMMLGVVMFLHDIWLILVFSLLYIIYYERIIFAEEAFLSKKFGAEFTQWAARTPAIIPKFSLYRPPNLKFNFLNVLRREYNGFFAVIVSMFALELASDFFLEHKLELDLHWIIVGGFGLLVWLTLRLVKKHTNWLTVSGR